MNANTAILRQKQPEISKTQKDQRAGWRHVQPWQFRADKQGRKYRLVCWRERRLAKIIASYASKSGSCWASVETLASKLGRSPAQTARYLARLKEQGIVLSKGLSHKHGARVRTLDPSALALTPTNRESQPSVNSYGLKKGLCYRPAYAPTRESESSTVRESESSTCANVRGKSFLRRSSVQRQQLAVSQDVQRTCELLTASPRKIPPSKERGKTSFPQEGSKILNASTVEKNLETYMVRNSFQPIKEWQEYKAKVWKTREEWIRHTRQDRLNWDDACEATGYSVNYDDAFVCWEFLDIVKEVADKHSRDADITPVKLCMKVLDRCRAERPTVPFPPSFLAHKKRLCDAEKRDERQA